MNNQCLHPARRSDWIGSPQVKLIKLVLFNRVIMITHHSEVKIYKVGGYVRDQILGEKSKDIDYAVEASSYKEMKEFLNTHGKIYVETPKYFTLRGKYNGEDADFTLCRKERDYTNCRHPDNVTVGTLYDDISRRDFTCNAIAIDEDGKYIDYFGGIEDTKNRILRSVGSAHERLTEDGLRVFRAFRFNITRDMKFDDELKDALTNSEFIIETIKNISDDRIREELYKCFAYDTCKTLEAFENYPEIRKHVFSRIKLIPTSKKLHATTSTSFIQTQHKTYYAGFYFLLSFLKRYVPTTTYPRGQNRMSFRKLII